MIRFRFLVVLVFFAVAGQTLHAQNYQIRFDAIPVIINGVTCISPLNGGIDQPRFQFVDIDGDGKLDLFIYDRDTTLNYYHNIGTAANPVFRLDSLKYLQLPILNWFKFVDIRSAGVFDLFTGSNAQSMRYYKNMGTPQVPNFVLNLDPVRSNTDSIIFSEAVCIPTFADIDGNGTLDFFTGNSVGTVTYYKNIGTPQQFNFQFVTNQFSGISIIGGGDNSSQQPPKSDPEHHGASSIMFADITASGKLDLFWGDFFGKSVYYIKNTGTPQNFTWNTIDTNNPKPSPWFSPGFNMPGIYDIDGDGKKDFFIGVISGSVTKNNFAFYKNVTTVNTNPQFSLITKNFIPCIDVGSNSYPAFCDINNDGTPDLFIGSSNATLSYYKNTGTPFNPAFTLVADSMPIISTSFNYAPTFGDLDGDGKKDLLLGAFDGKLRYFKNTGTVQNPAFTFTASQFDNISVAQSSAPVLVDLNGDGLLDLLLGDSGGHLAYYINDGTPTIFHFTLVSAAFQNIFVQNDSAPTLADMDGDGDLDMLIGNRFGKLYYYRNDGSPTNPNFVLVSNNYANIAVSLYCIPALVDINNDGDQDIFIGNIKGGLYYYENRTVIGIQPINSEIPSSFRLYQNFPNPFNPTTTMRFAVPLIKGGNRGLFVKLTVYDVLGKEVATLVNQQLQPGTYETKFDGANLSSGMYFYRLQAGDYTETKKMVLLK